MATAHLDLTRSYELQNDSFFFDTSALIFIHGPFLDPNDLRTAAYSELLSHIARGELEVFINQAVVSEFVNQFIRQHHAADVASGFPEEFKRYRSSERYQEVVESLADEMYHILAGVSLIDSQLSSGEIQAMADGLSDSNLDFNDMLIQSDCSRHNLVLVTHDSDFADTKLRLASANKKLLRLCE